MSFLGVDLGPIDDITGGVTDAAGEVFAGLSGKSKIGKVGYDRRSALEDPRAQEYLARQDRMAEQQRKYLSQSLLDRAYGRGPSPAEMQMRQGQQAALRQQLALASSARGGSAAQAQARRAAMFNAADINSQLAQQAAVLRAQEQERAGQQYLAGLTGLRSQEAQTMAMLAQDEARMQQLEQEAKLASSGAQTQMYGAGMGFLGSTIGTLAK